MKQTLAELETLYKELITELAPLDPRSSIPFLDKNKLALANSAPSTLGEDQLNGYQLENHPRLTDPGLNLGTKMAPRTIINSNSAYFNFYINQTLS